MIFNREEQRALYVALKEILLADKHIDGLEVEFLNDVLSGLDSYSDLTTDINGLSLNEAIVVLSKFSEDKMFFLEEAMIKMINADNHVDYRELEIFEYILKGIKLKSSKLNSMEHIDLSNIYFESADHLRYESGTLVSGPHGGAKRVVKVENNISGAKGYSVSIYNSDAQMMSMAHKQMEIVSIDEYKIVMRGWGEDPIAAMFGSPLAKFSNYGITIYHNQGIIDKIVLNRYHDNVDIVYLR